MKTAVHFGAGKIGRGFIGELLHDSGYRVVFVDVAKPLVDFINNKHQYSLFLINHDYKEKVIDNVIAYSSIEQPEKVIAAIDEAEVITTSVMASNLSKIAPILAQGLKKRFIDGKTKATIMACENAMMGTNILKKAILETGIVTAKELDAVGCYPNTAVDRTVFGGRHNGVDGVEIGDAYELAIEKEKLLDPNHEPIHGAEYVDNLEMYLQRKIYVINCGHAISAYLGQIYGYQTVQEALQDDRVMKDMQAAVLESIAALEKKYGFSHESMLNYMQNMMLARFTMKGISDPITRVAREPLRKISPNDRIMGPANECEAYGLPNQHLLKGVAAALHYHNPEDCQAVELQNYIAANGVGSAIVKYTGIAKDSTMYNTIVREYEKLSKV